MSVPLSVLDLAPVGAGQSAADALHGTTRLAQRADELGFRRFWVAEHHNIPSVASTAPETLIAHIAASTPRIRVGSGGVMLPNHAPLAVAERFGMLEALHPDRIDLGLGRAPGTDMRTAMALRSTSPEDFEEQFAQLRGHLGHGYGGMRAVAGEHTVPELWMLGSTDGGARIAAKLGLPFVFAHHFHPHFTEPALELYRALFSPPSCSTRRARSSRPGSSSATTTRTPPAARCPAASPCCACARGARSRSSASRRPCGSSDRLGAGGASGGRRRRRPRDRRRTADRPHAPARPRRAHRHRRAHAGLAGRRRRSAHPRVRARRRGVRPGAAARGVTPPAG